MAATKLQSKSGKASVGDRATDESQINNYRGTGAGTSTVSRTTLTASYVAGVVIDMEDYDTLNVLVDYDKQGGTGLRLRVRYGDTDDIAQILAQETRDDDSGAGATDHELLEHTFGATGVYGGIIFKRLNRFMVIEAKSDGTPTTDAAAFRIYGQMREK